MNRRKFIKSTLAFSAITLSGSFGARKKAKAPVVTKFTSNPALQTVNAAWQGTPVDQNGNFMNHEFPINHEFSTAFKWMLERNPQRDFKKNDTWQIPVLTNDTWLNDANDKIVWFGHASFFIQLSGVKILIDPVFGKLPVGKRYSEMPILPNKLMGIDYILVSHAHYDHCDKDSIKLLAHQNPNCKILTGLQQDKLISKWVKNNIETAGWYQKYSTAAEIEIVYLPSRHWANRGTFDINTTLWGGFLIKIGNKTIYHGGDSGHGSHYKEAGELFANIDVALIGAGAYAPKWFMAPNHQDPHQAVDAFHATGAKTFIPFHYGTFDSADEPMGEPEQILNQLNDEGKIQGNLKILKLGEVFEV